MSFILKPPKDAGHALEKQLEVNLLPVNGIKGFVHSILPADHVPEALMAGGISLSRLDMLWR